MRYFGRTQSNFRQYKPTPRGIGGWFKRWRKKRDEHTAAKDAHWRNNPYRHGGNRPTGRYLVTICLVILVLSWVALMLYLPYFRITATAYDGLKIIKKEQLDADVRARFLTPGKILPWNNYFLVSTGRIERYLQKNYSLNGVTVKKNFPHGLQINLDEKISSVVWDNEQNYYLLDREGKVIKTLMPVREDEFTTTTAPTTAPAEISTATDPLPTKQQNSVTVSSTLMRVHTPAYQKIVHEFGDYPVVYDLRRTTSTENAVLVAPTIITAIIQWQAMMEKQGIGQVRYFEMDNSLAGLRVVNSTPWDVYIQPADNLDTQISNLRVILRSNQPKEYVDLRYGGRVYWK